MLDPLQFQPVLKRYLWGGRRLSTELGKSLGPGDDYAESWELADHQSGQSVVAGGPLAGQTLHHLVARHGPELFGRHDPQPRFPLLFKFLDCQQDLSVQVHPNDAAAARLDPPDLGKTEAWLVLSAQPGSRVYAGLKPGYDRAAVDGALRSGHIERCLHSFEPRAGDCIFIPAGTVHALGAGLLVAEIQQASDTTYRLHDWNRVGADGQPRTLHLEAGLAAINFAAGPVRPVVPMPTAWTAAERLVTCDKFVLDRWKLTAPAPLGGDERFHILSVLEGEVVLRAGAGDPARPAPAGDLALVRGQTVLLPACLGPATIAPHGPALLIDMYLP